MIEVKTIKCKDCVGGTYLKGFTSGYVKCDICEGKGVVIDQSSLPPGITPSLDGSLSVTYKTRTKDGGVWPTLSIEMKSKLNDFADRIGKARDPGGTKKACELAKSRAMLQEIRSHLDPKMQACVDFARAEDAKRGLKPASDFKGQHLDVVIADDLGAEAPKFDRVDALSWFHESMNLAKSSEAQEQPSSFSWVPKGYQAYREGKFVCVDFAGEKRSSMVVDTEYAAKTLILTHEGFRDMSVVDQLWNYELKLKLGHNIKYDGLRQQVALIDSDSVIATINLSDSLTRINAEDHLTNMSATMRRKSNGVQNL